MSTYTLLYDTKIKALYLVRDYERSDAHWITGQDFKVVCDMSRPLGNQTDTGWCGSSGSWRVQDSVIVDTI